MKMGFLIGIVGIGAGIFILSKKGNEQILSGGGGSMGSISYAPALDNPNLLTKKEEKKINNQDLNNENLNNENFKVAIYQDNYKNYRSSGNSEKRIYIENQTQNFTVVKDNNNIVGGYDFNTSQSITKKQASFLEQNKNNPIIGIVRGNFGGLV